MKKRRRLAHSYKVKTSDRHKCVAKLRRKYYIFNLGNTRKHLLVTYTMTDNYVQCHINGVAYDTIK